MRKRTRRAVRELSNPLVRAMVNSAITSTEDLDKLRAEENDALQACQQGTATPFHWKRLADVANLARTMAEGGGRGLLQSLKVGPEVLPVVERANEALGEALRRRQEHGHLGFSGPELQTMKELLEWHDLQRSSVPRAVYAEAIRLTVVRIQQTPESARVEI